MLWPTMVVSGEGLRALGGNAQAVERPLIRIFVVGEGTAQKIQNGLSSRSLESRPRKGLDMSFQHS